MIWAIPLHARRVEGWPSVGGDGHGPEAARREPPAGGGSEDLANGRRPGPAPPRRHALNHFQYRLVGEKEGDEIKYIHEDDAGRGALLKELAKPALWTGLALCIAIIAWVAWGFLQFDHDIDNPREGGFSGWQCDARHDCGS